MSSDRVSALSMGFDPYRVFLRHHLLLLLNLVASECLSYTPSGPVPPKEGSNGQRKPREDTCQQSRPPALGGKQPKFLIQSLRCEYFGTQFKPKDVSEGISKRHCVTNAIFRKHTLIFFLSQCLFFYFIFESIWMFLFPLH